MGVDFRDVYDVNGIGRRSVRISSKKKWTHGLFVADIYHMPGGICGTWPAYWLLGPNWPYTGEIDIMEGVNDATKSLMSLHTSTNCTIAGDMRTELGTLQAADCAYNPVTGANPQGCSVLDNRDSFGTPFNAENGGVYATQVCKLDMWPG